MKEPTTILTMMYDFLVYLVPQLSKFPRDHKFLLGDRTQTLAHDILDDLISAWFITLSHGLAVACLAAQCNNRNHGPAVVERK